MENTLKDGQSFMKLDKAYKKAVEETEKNLNNSIMIGKQKLLEKRRAEELARLNGIPEEVKEEVKEQKEDKEEKIASNGEE